ncbi:MAG: hypothetical protein HGA49_02780 [Eubacteriaceae bacterium]|nr:hypothetical protein [Eubacteriaceae bacterium]
MTKEVIPNNRRWMRGGHLNSKRIFELTEEEKAGISHCTGTKYEHPCKNPVFRCSECGNYGCDQEVPDKCTAQGFKNGKCMHCGVMDSRIPVMEHEFKKFVAEWEKEIPIVEEPNKD